MTVGLIEATGEASEISGIKISFSLGKGKEIPYSPRDFLVHQIIQLAEANKDFDWSKPFLEIKLPCGHSVVYEGSWDVPAESVPCTCGNPNHWFIQYGISEGVGDGHRNSNR